MTERAPVTYRAAGVDIDAGEELVERIKPHVQPLDASRGAGRHRRIRRAGGNAARPLPQARAGLGHGRSRHEAAPGHRYRPPRHRGHRPGGHVRQRRGGPRRRAAVFSRLLCDRARSMWTSGERVIAGIVEGCVQAGCALVGGETAEMPGMYHGKDYDLAGFCVGVVEKDRIIDGSQTAAGDVVLGLPSSGPHSNGFSLIRKILEVSGADPASARRRRPPHRSADGARPGSTSSRCSSLHRRGARAWTGAYHRRRPGRQHPARVARGAGGGA